MHRLNHSISDNSSTHSECTNLEALSVASDQDRFETAYDAFRNPTEGPHAVLQGCHQRRCVGCPVTKSTEEAVRVGAFPLDLVISETDYPTSCAC